MKARFKPQDAKGIRLRKGDRVRIIGVPPLVGIPKDNELNTHAVFQYLRGKVKFIRGFDRYGHAEIFFIIRSGVLAGWHGVCIEPQLLLRQRNGHKA